VPDASESAVDPLALPARAAAFAYVAQVRRAVGIAELAEHLGLHPTGVRVHLAALEDAGILLRRRVRGVRGRPRDTWVVAPGARAVPPGLHEELASWLAGALGEGATSPEALERHGHRLGRDLVPDVPPGTPPVTAVGDALAAMGFRPACRSRPGGAEFALRTCPYRDAVRAGGYGICALHAGITRGLLEALSPDAELVGFVAGEPDSGDCRAEVAAPDPA
jgi:predicted ArsR family transcriptional regulator